MVEGSSRSVGYGAAVILVVAATARELEFVSGADMLVCGIGPVESALATAAALAEGAPRVVLHIGIAGARTLDPPTLVIGSEAVYADVLDPLSTFPRVSRVEPDQALVATARRVLPDSPVLPIATTGRVGGGGVCEVEAMEGFGVLRAAARAGVPALEVRAVSNAVGEQDRARWRVDEALAALAAGVPLLIAALHA
jgi:futalosine hydrolase